jgi:hypothetical protein
MMGKNGSQADNQRRPSSDVPGFLSLPGTEQVRPSGTPPDLSGRGHAATRRKALWCRRETSLFLHLGINAGAASPEGPLCRSGASLANFQF